MPIQVASDFLSSGSGSGGTVDGLPTTPQGTGVTASSHTRTYAIAGSTDEIRLPLHPESVGVSTLGYRRVDNQGSGGASEWIISWEEVAAFTGYSVANLDDCNWSNSQVKGTKIYIGFHDKLNKLGFGVSSFMLVASVVTGIIESVTRFDITNITVQAAAYFNNTMDGVNTSQIKWWEILDNGNIRIVSLTTTSTLSTSGFCIIEMNPDLVTVVSQSIHLDSDSVGTVDSVDYIAYATKDLSIVLGYHSSNTQGLQILLKDHGRINTSLTSDNGSSFLKALSCAQGASTGSSRRHHLSDNNLCLKRWMYNNPMEYDEANRRAVDRDLVDQYLKDYVLAYSGIVL